MMSTLDAVVYRLVSPTSTPHTRGSTPYATPGKDTRYLAWLTRTTGQDCMILTASASQHVEGYSTCSVLAITLDAPSMLQSIRMGCHW